MVLNELESKVENILNLNREILKAAHLIAIGCKDENIKLIFDYKEQISAL